MQQVEKALLLIVENLKPNFLAAKLKISSAEDALDDGIGTAYKQKKIDNGNVKRG